LQIVAYITIGLGRSRTPIESARETTTGTAGADRRIPKRERPMSPNCKVHLRHCTHATINDHTDTLLTSIKSRVNGLLSVLLLSAGPCHVEDGRVKLTGQFPEMLLWCLNGDKRQPIFNQDLNLTLVEVTKTLSRLAPPFPWTTKLILASATKLKISIFHGRSCLRIVRTHVRVEPLLEHDESLLLKVVRRNNILIILRK
jgi:hypothetical protein